MTRLYYYALMLAAVIALCVGAMAAVADTTRPQNAPQSQPQRKVVRGTFTQRKYLAELKQPLVSSGHYVVAARHGLIWQVEKPVQAELVISRKHLIRRSDGHEIMRINANQQPALQIVAAVLLAVFQADTDQLHEYFNVKKQPGEDDDWLMTLRPKSATVGQFIDHLRVRGTGTAHINHIELYQPGGDHTVIDLHAATGGPDTLSAAEQAEFAR